MKLRARVSLVLALVLCGPVLSSAGEPGSLGPDYVVRLVSRGEITGEKKAEHAPLQACRLFEPGLLVGKNLDKAGLGPLLQVLTEKDPIFQDAFGAVLADLFANNRRLVELNGVELAVPTGNRGAEPFARAIVVAGGSVTPKHLIDDLGYTWTVLYDASVGHAREALGRGGVTGTEEEMALLEHVIAVGVLAALSNRMMPKSYVQRWLAENRAIVEPMAARLKSDLSGTDEDRVARERLVPALPWLFHTTGMPRAPWGQNDLARYYDSFHFFSHAWYALYTLYRDTYWGRCRGFQPKRPGRTSVHWAMLRSDFVGIAYEFETMFLLHGFLEMKPVEHCTGILAKIARKLGIKELPAYEALADIRINQEGRSFGAACFVSPLADHDPANFKNTARLLDRFFKGKER